MSQVLTLVMSLVKSLVLTLVIKKGQQQTGNSNLITQRTKSLVNQVIELELDLLSENTLIWL